VAPISAVTEGRGALSAVDFLSALTIWRILLDGLRGGPGYFLRGFGWCWRAD
jgi:hypothetical protein